MTQKNTCTYMYYNNFIFQQALGISELVDANSFHNNKIIKENKNSKMCVDY